MKAERSTRRRRVLTRYSAEDRERLIREQAASGETKKAFCEQRGINLGTFHGWPKRTGAIVHKPRFAKVEISCRIPADTPLLSFSTGSTPF